jgi:hypothetical protein
MELSEEAERNVIRIMIEILLKNRAKKDDDDNAG